MAVKRRRPRKRKTREVRIVDGKVSYEMTDDEKGHLRGMEKTFGASPLNQEMYDPPEEKKIPEKGAWIMTLRTPPINPKFKLALGQAFYATRVEESDDQGFPLGGFYKVNIFTPWGTCYLFPYEYFVLTPERLIEMYQYKELVFHPLTEKPKISDMLFYIRTRGIPLSEAMVMALGTFEDGVGWFEPNEELAEMIKNAYGNGMSIGTGLGWGPKEFELEEDGDEGEGEQGTDVALEQDGES